MLYIPATLESVRQLAWQWGRSSRTELARSTPAACTGKLAHGLWHTSEFGRIAQAFNGTVDRWRSRQSTRTKTRKVGATFST